MIARFTVVWLGCWHCVTFDRWSGPGPGLGLELQALRLMVGWNRASELQMDQAVDEAETVETGRQPRSRWLWVCHEI